MDAKTEISVVSTEFLVKPTPSFSLPLQCRNKLQAECRGSNLFEDYAEAQRLLYAKRKQRQCTI